MMDNTSWASQDLVILLLISCCYVFSNWLHKFCRGHALANPLLITSLLCAICLFVMGIDIQQYTQGISFLSWLLGPVTILLAVPLYQQLTQARQQLASICIPIVVGGVSAPVLAYLLVSWFEPEAGVKLAILTKSITTPLAMETASSIGAYPQLAAVFVSMTGIIGAVCASWLFKFGKIHSQQAQGLSLGTCAHAIGTARAAQISDKTAGYSSMALCINGILTAIILPLLIWWLEG